jgi:hypothetical protein
MRSKFIELISELENIKLEQISEMMISSLRNDKKQVLIEGIHFTDNIYYAQKDIFYVKGKTGQKEFYVRSDGNDNTNLLLHSHLKEIIKDELAGVFSIGSAINNKSEEIILCICQIIDYSRLEQIQHIFHKNKIPFKGYDSKHFGIKSAIIFAYL